jgi:hypothetical protein
MSKEEGVALREKRKTMTQTRISQKVKSDERRGFLGRNGPRWKRGVKETPRQ